MMTQDRMIYCRYREVLCERKVARINRRRPIGAERTRAIALSFLISPLKITRHREKQPLGDIFRRHEKGSCHTIGRTIERSSSFNPINPALRDGLGSIQQDTGSTTSIMQTQEIMDCRHVPCTSPFSMGRAATRVSPMVITALPSTKRTLGWEFSPTSKAAVPNCPSFVPFCRT